MGSGGKPNKPRTTFAPPPVSAVLTVILFVSTALYFFPEFDHPDPTIYTQRVFPNLISVEVLLYARLFFTAVCFYGFIMAWFYPNEVITPPYRPTSKLARVPIVLNGFKKNWPFTGMSWILLGLQFAASSYITYCQVNNIPVDPSVVSVALTMWEVTAPMTFLIGAVVKYALWPAQIKVNGSGGPFLRPRALLLHNANVMMAASELALLGGLPVQFDHISVSVLYGCAYILFTWSVQMQWRDGEGPSFVYFFMDTTLGWEHTLALYALLATLMIFHGLFCGVEQVLEMTGNNLAAHIALSVGLCSLVCRFKD